MPRREGRTPVVLASTQEAGRAYVKRRWPSHGATAVIIITPGMDLGDIDITDADIHSAPVAGEPWLTQEEVLAVLARIHP